MAGIPAVMQGMLDEVAHEAQDRHEIVVGDISVLMPRKEMSETELGAIAKAHPSTIIGSYPFIDEKNGPNTNIVVRSRATRASLRS